MTAVGTDVLPDRDALVSRGPARLRSLVLDVVEAGLQAADPAPVVREVVSRGPRGAVVVDGIAYRPGRGGRILVLGAGKASVRIAAALDDVLGDAIAEGVVVSQALPAEQPRRIELLTAGHPVPTQASRRAALRLMRLAETAGPQDVVLACFTGGSSALASLPANGVRFEEKRELHQLLLGSGAPIRDINRVRKHVSRFKGGRLAAAAGGASIVNLTVSDVVDDPLDAITDPTVRDTTTARDAIEVLHAYDLWDDVAPSIRRHLSTPRAESPALDGVAIHSRILVNGEDVAKAMVRRCAELGIAAHVLSTGMEGESRDVGAALAAIAVETHDHGRPFSTPCMLLGAGGETTVTLRHEDHLGDGGPNQAAALAAALRVGTGRAIAAAFVDTDGMDGGTGIAGALVDGSTLERAAALDLDLRQALLQHRSSDALCRLGDAIVTGRTGSNVNDLFAIAVDRRQNGGDPA
jgi:glycerate-2-kinase